MLEVIGAVGSRSGLCRRLCCYVIVSPNVGGSLEASRGGMLEVIGAVGCILGTYPFPYWHISPNVGALLRLLVEVCWK